MAQAIILKDEVEGKKVKPRSMQHDSKVKKQSIAKITRRLTETMLGAVHEYVNSCPKFIGNQLIEFEQTLNELETLKISRDKTLGEISIIENKTYEIFGANNIPYRTKRKMA